MVVTTTASHARISLNSTDDHNLRTKPGALELMPITDRWFVGEDMGLTIYILSGQI